MCARSWRSPSPTKSPCPPPPDPRRSPPPCPGPAALHRSYYVRHPDMSAERAANDALYKYRAKSLASEFPDVAKEFHPDKNDGVAPETVHPGSQTKFWWLCAACGFEWLSPVWVRTAGHSCPRCANLRGAAKRALPPPGESFADLFPEAAKEWHPTLNGTLTASQVRPTSGKIVWWQCPHGHEWQARVVDRRKFGVCRECRAMERRARG